MMNSIEPNPEVKHMIYQNINKKTSKKNGSLNFRGVSQNKTLK